MSYNSQTSYNFTGKLRRLFLILFSTQILEVTPLVYRKKKYYMLIKICIVLKEK